MIRSAAARHRLARSLSLALLLSGTAGAERLPGTELPEALKGIKPAAGVCAPLDPAPSPSTPPKKPAKPAAPPDLSCALPAAELAQHRADPETLLVDIRPPLDYNAFHIEGAVNASASELSVQRAWRDKAVVLIGTGKAERELYAACARLKAKGWARVKVLRGGLPTWLASGGAVLGRTPELAGLADLSPTELWVESQFKANLVLATPARDELRRQLVTSAILPEASSAALKAALGQRQSRKTPLAAVVLVAEAAPATLAPLRQAIQPVPLLTYTGTAEAYARQAEQREAVWAAQARGPRQPAGCGR